MPVLRSVIFAFFIVAGAWSPLKAETTVKIGVLTDLAGPYRDFAGQGSVVAAQMAAEDFMAATPGFRVEIVAADHQNKAEAGRDIAERWLGGEGVDAILDVPSTAVALEASAAARKHDRTLILSGASHHILTGKMCSPNTIHWTFDSWATGFSLVKALSRRKPLGWFFVTANYPYGLALEREAGEALDETGAKIAGNARHAFPAGDLTLALLEAKSSGAGVVALASVGADSIAAIRKAAEFGPAAGDQTIAGLMLNIADVSAVGLEAAQGVMLAESFYWDLNDATRSWSRRFAARHSGRMPTMAHAGVYAGTLHYLKAVAALGGDKSGSRVAAKMKELDTDDPLFGRGTIRPDGRKLHPMHVFEVKKPSESKEPWDYYRLVETVPAHEAFRPVYHGGCPTAAY